MASNGARTFANGKKPRPPRKMRTFGKTDTLLEAKQNNRQQPKQKEQQQPPTTVATKTDLSFVHIATNLLHPTESGNMREAALFYHQKGGYLPKPNEHVDRHDYRQPEHH